MSLQIVILAAGQGKRMHSSIPKVLHNIAGKPMLSRVIDIASQLNPDGIHVIIGHEGGQIKEQLPNIPVNWVEQKKQLGTGHALRQALPFIPDSSQVLVLSADVPLIQKKTLHQLIESARGNGQQKPSLALLVANMDNPAGLGRIVRDTTGKILSIVEEKDANPAQKAIKEIYSGICCAQANDLNRWLPMLTNENAQGEYYLTDVIHIAANENKPIASIQAAEPIEIQGVNNRLQLQKLERAWQKNRAETLMLSGVTLADATRIDIRGNIETERDVFIDVNNVFIGHVKIGKNSIIGPNCLLKNVQIGDNAVIKSNSVLEDCTIADSCEVGPFARLRPGTKLQPHCKIGNFVELKNAAFAPYSKASHLSYLGDVTVGKNVNIGAGTITCNYDGANKYHTVIEDGAFIGSDTQLVAPVTIGSDATIGAGSTIRKNAPPGELTLTVSEQKSISGWKRPVKK